MHVLSQLFHKEQQLNVAKKIKYRGCVWSVFEIACIMSNNHHSRLFTKTSRVMRVTPVPWERERDAACEAHAQTCQTMADAVQWRRKVCLSL